MASKKNVMPITQAINAIAGLRAADKPLLAEVCGLFHNGGSSTCNASNKYLSARLGEAPETVSRRLARLATAGWIIIDLGKEQGFARTLTPSPKMLSAYLPVNSPLLTKSIGAIDESADSLLIVINEQNEQLMSKDEECASLHAALASKKNELDEAQKKIGEWQARALLAEAEVDTMKARSAPNPKARVTAKFPGLVGDLAELLNEGGEFEAVQRMKKPITQSQADKLLTDYGFELVAPILRDMANYAKLDSKTSANLTARTWLDREATKQQNNPSHVNGNYSGSQNGFARNGQRTAAGLHQKSFEPLSEAALQLARNLVTGTLIGMDETEWI